MVSNNIHSNEMFLFCSPIFFSVLLHFFHFLYDHESYFDFVISFACISMLLVSLHVLFWSIVLCVDDLIMLVALRNIAWFGPF